MAGVAGGCTLCMREVAPFQTWPADPEVTARGMRVLKATGRLLPPPDCTGSHALQRRSPGTRCRERRVGTLCVRIPHEAAQAAIAVHPCRSLFNPFNTRRKRTSSPCASTGRLARGPPPSLSVCRG
eukprot:1050319-Pelagomonas_calceolata.AAC.2